MVEQVALPLSSVVEGHMERAAQRYHQLLEPLMRMSATALAARHVVDSIGTLDVERNILQTLSHGQVAAWVANLWQVDDLSYHFFVVTLVVTFALSSAIRE